MDNLDDLVFGGGNFAGPFVGDNPGPDEMMLPEGVPLDATMLPDAETEQCTVSEKSSGFYEYLKDLEPGAHVAFFVEGHNVEKDNLIYTGHFKRLYGMGSGIVVALHSCGISSANNPYPSQELAEEHECVLLIDRIIDIVSVRKQKEEGLEEHVDARKLDLD